MEINDNQRRKVAKKMREYDVAEFKESAIVPFLECLGHGYMNWRGILDELADLIEPQERTCHAVEKGNPDEHHVCYGCSVCSFGWYEDVYAEPYRYCPHCGARVTGGARIKEESE